MRGFVCLALASTSLAALASGASAQPAPGAAAGAAGEATLGEIVVTARRRAESLQEVPQTVNAVTSDTLQKLNITQFADVQTVVPGLSLQNRADGISQSASMRGVTFDVNTAAPVSTVAMYVNDAAVQSGFAFNTLFDVGQIEVLRGPQGAARGVSAPSGAITITTRRPDLSDLGGYLDLTLTDLQGRNAQGALNIPIIRDVLAVRAAGFVDQNAGAGTRSIHNDQRQNFTTSAERFAVSFEPADIFNANLVYQHTDKRIHAFDPVSGPGHAGPDGFVDPPLSPFDRAAVEDGISDTRIHSDLVTAQIDSRFLGQHLSYVGSYAFSKIHTRQLSTSVVADVGDIVPRVELYTLEDVGTKATTHELRLASDPAPGRFFDYVVGGYYSWIESFGPVVSPPIPAQGAFGPPFQAPILGYYDPSYALASPLITIPSNTQETSLFATVTLHLGDRTELSGGIRHIWSVFRSNTSFDFGTTHIALPASEFGGACGALPASVWPGFCDVSVPLGGQASSFRASDTPNVYQVSLSHHFTRDLLAYVNTGTSYRPTFSSPGVQSAEILASTDPLVHGLVVHPGERSRSYELGVKWTFLHGRGRVNADIYRQRFHNFTIIAPNVQTIDAAPFPFTATVDALVQGLEVDSAFQVTPNWNVNVQYSYSDGKLEGSLVPCNTFDAAGDPTFNRGPISFCPGGASSRLPFWNLSLTSEYYREVAENLDGFLRVLFSYYPENKNRMEPDFTVPGYGLLNLYAGVRSHDGAWEVSVFAKNALYNKTVLDRSPLDSNLNTYLEPVTSLGYEGFFPSSSGYFSTLVTPEREVGVTVRYAWGSR